MKRMMLGGFALALLLGAMALPGFAQVVTDANPSDVLVNATLTKKKDITVTETISATKVPLIQVSGTFALNGAAEAQSITNTNNKSNTVTSTASKHVSTIGTAGVPAAGSILANTGIIGVNQDSGNMVNQGNSSAFALTDAPNVLAHAEAWANQRNELNTVPGNKDIGEATIDSSVADNKGIIGVNQNTGNMNDQTNAVAMTVGLGSKVALAESVLGQVNGEFPAGVGTGPNTVTETSSIKTNLISGSASGNSGVVAINQTSGNMNLQASAVSFAAINSTISVSSPGR